MKWLRLVCTLNGQCSGICTEASYREKRLTLAERGRNGRFNDNYDDDDEHIEHYYVLLDDVIYSV